MIESLLFSSIADFIGKNIWVKCYDYQTHQLVFARFIRKYNTLPSQGDRYLADLTDLYMLGTTNFSGAVDTYDINANHFGILTPIVTATTEELFPDCNINQHQFDRFVNTNVWVKAINSGGYDYYINIRSISNSFMSYYQLYPDVLDDAYFEYDDLATTVDDVWEKIYNKIEHAFVDSWELCIPIDILSTEEITEILELNLGDRNEDI